jgi:hypothetical protein
MLCLVVFSGAFGCYFYVFKKCSTGGRKDHQIQYGSNQCIKICYMGTKVSYGKYSGKECQNYSIISDTSNPSIKAKFH